MSRYPSSEGKHFVICIIYISIVLTLEHPNLQVVRYPQLGAAVVVGSLCSFRSVPRRQNRYTVKRWHKC